MYPSGKAWSARQVDPEGWCASCKEEKPEDAERNDLAIARHICLLVCSALPEELNSMAAGGDVKETVMTIPFLRTCMYNVIGDLERKFILDGNQRRALLQPEAPWKWFTSYELGFPLVSDKYERPSHPVETFVDGQLGACSTEEEEVDVSLPALIGLLRTTKEGWCHQTSTGFSLIAKRAATGEKFSTSHTARNPLKLPETELVNEYYLPMNKNPPAVK